MNLRRGWRSYRGLCHLLRSPTGQRERYPDRPTVWRLLEVRTHLVLRSNLRKRWNLWKKNNNVGHPSPRLSQIAPSAGSRTPSRRLRLGTLPCRFWLVKCITLDMVLRGIPKRSFLSSYFYHSMCNVIIDCTPLVKGMVIDSYILVLDSFKLSLI